jgi:hypothetical protein
MKENVYKIKRSSKKTMRKTTVCLIVSLISLSAIISCSGKKDYSAEQGLLNMWANAAKNHDLGAYSRTSAYPRTAEQFNEMYRDYYFTDIVVVDVSGISDPVKDPGSQTFVKKEISFTGYSVNRKDNKKSPMTGKVDLVKFTGGTSWLVASRVVNLSE